MYSLSLYMQMQWIYYIVLFCNFSKSLVFFKIKHWWKSQYICSPKSTLGSPLQWISLAYSFPSPALSLMALVFYPRFLSPSHFKYVSSYLPLLGFYPQIHNPKPITISSETQGALVDKAYPPKKTVQQPSCATEHVFLSCLPYPRQHNEIVPPSATLKEFWRMEFSSHVTTRGLQHCTKLGRLLLFLHLRHVIQPHAQLSE